MLADKIGLIQEKHDKETQVMHGRDYLHPATSAPATMAKPTCIPNPNSNPKWNKDRNVIHFLIVADY